MEINKLIKVLGFEPKENTTDVYIKKYSAVNNYAVEIDFDSKTVNFGNKIKGESKTTQNFSQAENWVVLECVDRILTKGYKPEDITLEKVFPSGHGHSGRLDVFIQKNGKAFLMIECKTFGKEYEKELKNIYKNGGQLFTYFQNDTNTEYLMLYTSHLTGNKIDANWDIVKIEDHYRGAGNVADFYDRWSKVTYQNGIFEDWVTPYDFKNKLLTKKELVPLKETDSEAIFHGFMSILRKHSVSDEPNAFNKIFNLFLAKIYDEKKRDNDELDFQWREKIDDPVEFQIRLINLYQKGMYEFLRKEVEGISDNDFVFKTEEELQEKKKKWLMFNNVFAIKEVIDSESFDDNHRVLKEVVELLHKYQIRYPRRQAHLSDFFERLLTTGLKQKAGQFFSPPPITRFIVKSLPIKEMINEQLKGETAKLPAVIDYAVGSGHFITEIMEEYQNIIDNNIDTGNLYPDVIDDIEVWQRKKYDWAARYVYGIEKDYRLVKVAKVGCYFYGDGLAQIIHGDGLDSFKDSKSFVGRLQKIDDSELEKFSIVVSNPPYSVPTFKGDLKNKTADKDFELFNLLTDKSSEIECLFIERTKQLLKEDGLASIILPSSILTNTGNLHTKTRAIIFQNFDVIAIAEFGSFTFMATNTSTVTLFLRRKYKKIDELKKSCQQSINNAKDVTINGIQKSLSKYVNHVWEDISLEDYISLLKKKPNEKILAHEIYKEYKKNIKSKNEEEFWSLLLQREEEKLFYFVLTAQQKVVVVKSGSKTKEKQFLGYEFRNGKGSEGIHPVNGRSTIDDCTKMYNINNKNDPKKASTYINNAFKGKYFSEIDETLKENVFYTKLEEMLNFSRFEFDLNVSLNVKKKIKIETKWQEKRFDEVVDIIRGVTYSKADQTIEETENIVLTADNITLNGDFEINKEVYLFDGFNIPENKKLKKNDIFMCFSSGSKEHLGKVAFIENDTNYLAGGFMGIIRTKDEVQSKYVYQLLNSLLRQSIRDIGSGSNINNLSRLINELKIPVPPQNIQEKIVKEIEKIQQREEKVKKEIHSLNNSITGMINSVSSIKAEKLENISVMIKRGKSPKYGDSAVQIIKSGQARGIKEFDFSQKHYVDKNFILDDRKLKKGDILINSSGVGTAGRVTLFDIEGDFVVDSHITILRLDRNKALPEFVLRSLANLGFKNIEAMAMGQSGQIELSISTIQNIKLPIPPVSNQQKIVSEIEKIEKQIEILEQELSEIPSKKVEVLHKHLN